MKQITKQNWEPFPNRKLISVHNIEYKGKKFVTKYNRFTYLFEFGQY